MDDRSGWVDVRLRAAEAEDTPVIADMVLQAGGGIFEFLLDGLVPGVGVGDLLRMAVADPDGTLSFANAVVAEGESGICGLMLGYPAARYGLPALLEVAIPRRRLDHLGPLLTSRVDDSYYINTLVVAPEMRGQGLGRLLVECASEIGAEQGLSALSLHVWLDNFPALQLYRSSGFEIVTTLPIQRTETLAHDSGMALLKAPLLRPVSADGPLSAS